MIYRLLPINLAGAFCLFLTYSTTANNSFFVMEGTSIIGLEYIYVECKPFSTSTSEINHKSLYAPDSNVFYTLPDSFLNHVEILLSSESNIDFNNSVKTPKPATTLLFTKEKPRFEQRQSNESNPKVSIDIKRSPFTQKHLSFGNSSNGKTYYLIDSTIIIKSRNSKEIFLIPIFLRTSRIALWNSKPMLLIPYLLTKDEFKNYEASVRPPPLTYHTYHIS